MGSLESFRLDGKTAWITGGSYGIGFAIAEALHGAGAKIVFNDINQELLDKGFAAYKAANIPVHGYICDVTDEAAVNATVAKIEKDGHGGHPGEQRGDHQTDPHDRDERR